IFIVDKTPYKYITTDLTATQAYSIPVEALWENESGGATQVLIVVSGNASAQVKWRSDPVLGESALNGTPIFQYGSLELKNLDSIRNLRFYCVSAATLHITLM